MSQVIYPAKLSPGDTARIIAPSGTLKIISEPVRAIARERLESLGLTVSFGAHADEMDVFCSSSIASRVSDLHDAFLDPAVNIIFTAIGGFNTNQLLDYIEWDSIKQNPKALCGFSDITVLHNAIFAKTGLVTYSGPHYSTFGQKLHTEYTLDYFIKALFNSAPFEIKPSSFWSDDLWYEHQDDRILESNSGFLVVNEGACEGRLLGGHIGSFVLLKGTPYFPDLTDSILFLEQDSECLPHHFDRYVQSLIQLPSFKGVKGIIIGRFQRDSAMTPELLMHILKTKKELARIPVLANGDFGHTDPKITIPVGGMARLVADKKNPSFWITEF